MPLCGDARSLPTSPPLPSSRQPTSCLGFLLPSPGYDFRLCWLSGKRFASGRAAVGGAKMAEEKFRMVSAEVLLHRDRLRAGPGWAVRPGGEPRPGKAKAVRPWGCDAARSRSPARLGECQAVQRLVCIGTAPPLGQKRAFFTGDGFFFLLSRFFVFPGKGVRTFTRQFLITVDSKFDRTEAVSSQRSCPLTATGPCFPLWLCFGNQLFQNSAV